MDRRSDLVNLIEKYWARLGANGAGPLSERLHTFRACARDAARLISKDLSHVEIADRLQTLADASGLTLDVKVDAVQAILAEAFKEAINGFTEEDENARPPEFSDEALALQFAERHGRSVRYVAIWNKWLVWTGTHWVYDETLQVLDLARSLCREIASGCAQDRIAVSIASRKTVSAVVSLARADRNIAASVDQWDRDPWLLNTPTGTVDLRTGALRPHGPNNYLTKITNVGPDGSCPTPLWLGFLDRVCGGNIDFIAFLRRMLGYAITGETCEHALFFCYGTGANGKSTFINTVIHCLGDYHRTAPIETFTASGGERHPTDLAGLRGARLVTAVETEEGRRWNEAKIKSLTAGDRIAARFMRQDFFEYNPGYKLFIAGNHKPGLRSVDEAIRRRFHLLPFVATIPPAERDQTLGDKLKAEAPGILAWIIQGCLEWQRLGLDPPEVVKAATAEYLESEDALAAWIREATDPDPNAFELSTDLFKAWKDYAEAAGEFVGSARTFSSKLEERGSEFGVRKGRNSSGNRGFYGLRLRVTAHPAHSLDDDVVPL